MEFEHKNLNLYENNKKDFFLKKAEQEKFYIDDDVKTRICPTAKTNLQEIKDHKNINEVVEFCNQNLKFKDDLRINSFLNKGSSGLVYVGEIKKCQNKKVALKLLRSNKVLKEKRDKLMRKEVHIMNKLKNKNSISLYGMYDIGNKESICIVMEWAKYSDIENFQKLIMKNTLNESVIAYFAKQILIGLLNCKRNNIVHMDIKHQNIMIDENLVIKLSDYSVSIEISKTDIEKDQYTLPLVGTSLFMSPEVLSKKTVKIEDLHKVDMYSLGVLLYNLAFARYPYKLETNQKKNFNEILSRILHEKLEFFGSNKHSLLFKNFLSGLLNKNIEERFSIEEALNHKWIKAADILFEEKEKIADLEKFLINLVTDNVIPFNDFISKDFLD
jgi:serine/threonine protein kinase